MLRDKGVAGLAAVIDQRLLSAAAAEPARAVVRQMAARLHAQGYAQAVELLCASDLGQSAGRLSMPVHVWVGAQDIVTPPQACREWAHKLGAEFVLLPDAGHASPVEQPEPIVQRLRALWAQE